MQPSRPDHPARSVPLPPDPLERVGGQGGGSGWTPLTTPAGRALPLADQRRRTSPAQPLPGGLRLTPTHPAAGGEWRFTLANRAGQTLRGWRVTSRTDLGALGATPALAGLGLWLLYRRRHPTGPGPHGRSGVAS